VNIITPDNWKVEPLCHVTDVIMGQSPASKYYNFEGEGLPFFQGKTEFGELYPVARKWCSKPNKIAKNNDVLISVRAPVGPTNIANQECCIGRGLAAVRTLDGLPHKYILYFLRSIEQQIESLGTGTTFKAISGQTLRNLSVPIAPPEQQKQIVEEIEKQFSRLDKTIADLKRVKANLKRYKASVLQAAVTGKLTEAWRKQNPDVEPASKLLERILTERRQKWEATELTKLTAKGKTPKNDKWKEKYKEPVQPKLENEPNIPKSWAWASVGQLSWSVKDGPHYSPKYSDSGVPFISGGNIRPEGIDFSKTKFISQDLHTKLSERCKPEYGDLLYTKGGTTGIARVNTETREFNVWVHVAVLKLLSNIEPFYLQHALNAPHCYRQSQNYTHGVGNQDLGLTRMIWISIPLPSIDEQRVIIQEIESRMSVAEEIERTVDTNLKRAEQLRQSILKQAFSGKLV